MNDFTMSIPFPMKGVDMTASLTLWFEVGDKRVGVKVTDVESFLGTLRKMRGIRTVSRDRCNLIVELDESRPSQEIVDEIWHIYEWRVTVLPLHIPAPQ